jgi:hypothetical protein
MGVPLVHNGLYQCVTVYNRLPSVSLSPMLVCLSFMLHLSFNGVVIGRSKP